jgi:hypothetical protein
MPRRDKTPKPIVDFGYPTPAHGRIPAFNSPEEEAEFWDTHEITAYLDDLQPVDVWVSRELSSLLTREFDEQESRQLSERAQALGVTPLELTQRWIRDRLHQEREAS